MGRTRQKPISILDDDHIEALLGQCSKGATGARNRALILTLRGAALRCDEALELHLGDIDFRRALVQVRRGKGAKERTVGITPTALAMIESWLAARSRVGFGKYQGRRVFTTRAGGKLDDSYVRALLRRLAKRAGINLRVHPHALRHSAAVAMRRTLSDPLLIQRQLGHTSLATTQLYIDHLAPDELAAAMAATTPARAPVIDEEAAAELREQIAELTGRLESLLNPAEALSTGTSGR